MEYFVSLHRSKQVSWYSGVQDYSHITWCLCHFTDTRRVPLVGQERFIWSTWAYTRPHPRFLEGTWAYTRPHPRFLEGFSLSVVCFMCMFWRSLFVLLSSFLLAPALSVLWFTASDFPFGIFKLFIYTCHCNYIIFIS